MELTLASGASIGLYVGTSVGTGVRSPLGEGMCNDRCMVYCSLGLTAYVSVY